MKPSDTRPVPSARIFVGIAWAFGLELLAVFLIWGGVMSSYAIPEGSQFVLDGVFYKLGLRDWVFYWGVDRWLRSSKSAIPKEALPASSELTRKNYKIASECKGCASRVRYAVSNHCVFCSSADGKEARAIKSPSIRQAAANIWLKARGLL